MVDVPLIDSVDLAGFRGAPFSPAVVEAAAESLRSECGWHIAPVAEDTVRLRGGGSILLLPSLRVSGVASVVDGEGVAVTDWEWFESGVLERAGGFPRVVVVTFTHGYDWCPRELLPVIAERASSQASGRIKSEALAGRSVSLEGGYDPITDRLVSRYKVNGGP